MHVELSEWRNDVTVELAMLYAWTASQWCDDVTAELAMLGPWSRQSGVMTSLQSLLCVESSRVV